MNSLWRCSLPLIVFVLIINNAYPQTVTAQISGRVQGGDKKPVDGATVTLLRTADSTEVKSMLVNTNGTFAFHNLKDDSYRLAVSSVGFKKYRSANIVVAQQANVSLPVITLQSTNTALKEVAVTAQKPLVEQKIDRMVVNVGAQISNAGLNALEVLEKSPGVSVDADGKVSYKGKDGVLVMIDGKPTYLSAAGLASYLRSLPANTIDQIELMDNPPAKYDAAGGAGIINIKIKKNTIKGFNGVLTMNGAQGFYSRNGEGLNVNYRDNQINIFANVNRNYAPTFRQLEVDHRYFDAAGSPTSVVNDVSNFRPVATNYNIRAGVDYYLSPRTTWGIVFTSSLEHRTNNIPAYISFFDSTGGLDSTVLANNNTDYKFDNGGVNLNYTHQFDSAGTHSISFDADYIRNVNPSNQIYINDTYLPDNSLIAHQVLTADLPGSVNIYAGKVDYTHPISHKGKVEAGAKSSYVNTDNAANYFNVINTVTTPDYNKTNRFLYRENINAAYINYNQEFKRFSIQAGLRMENTNGHGHQLGNAQKPDSAFSRHYVNLFPTTYFLYKLDTTGHHVLTASYGRRIGRPNYSSLNPFTALIDKFSYATGNPFLRPQFSAVYKLAYGYKSLLNVTFAYVHDRDMQSETIHYDGPIFISTQDNIGKRTTLDLSVNLNMQPAKWWNLNFYAEVYRMSFSGQLINTYLNQSGNSFGFNGNNQFTLGKGWSAELSGFYNSRQVYAQFRTIPTGVLNAGLQKKILQNKGSVKLSLRDVLNSLRRSGVIEGIPNTAVSYSNFWDNRITTLSFSYSFGKVIKNPRKRDTGSADSEQGRAH
ncbi:outer membrane receptor protein involved in Fe transport [Mucilaginibacter yixingensis]|uniref:Outer membrane receptor protein involved in Fe transport n=1 Tax=Mucilaginibacter yixingensis TaxID=1295612 RepID=A0A2T5JF50_9SPHI|nr:TonB-dependent receptor [Mucilaginibacter yixingensis]PTR01062.1 outer membrane receptor protein involved in Fe transport [Mucilaginibacter yixingensis]